MSTEKLREELHRLGETAPLADVDPGTWGRARRARTRDRVLVAGAVLAVLALVGGLVGLMPTRESTPVAGTRGAVPDHVYAVTSIRDVPVASDLAVGRTAAAYETDIGGRTRVVTVAAADGRYHVLDLPRFADRGGTEAASPAPLALSPDGTQLAYAYAGGPPTHGGPTATGVTVVDLTTGGSRSVPLTGGEGILVRALSWSPDGRWLVWSGQVSTVWNARERYFGDQMSAGRITAGSDRSQPVPASDRTSQAFGIDSSGRVAITSASKLVVWDGTVIEQISTPRRFGLPLDTAHAGNPVADVRAGPAGQGHTAFHVLRWSGDGRSPSLATPDAGGVTVAVRGWLGDTPVVEAQPSSGGGSTTSLALLTDTGLREIGRLDAGVEDLTLATDLMTGSRPTADVPAPDWASRDGNPWAWIGLGVAGALALVGAAWWARRRASR